MTSERVATLSTGSLVGAYRLVKEIGRGGMGVVYEAHHTMLPRRAAVKVMHGDLRRQPGMATRMVQEAAILEDVRHPGIVRVYDCGLLPDHRPWIAMDLVEGDTLAARLHDGATLSPADVTRLLVEVADVLAAVHARGIVHRDLKPDNLLLTPSDPYYPLRVIDWGVARLGATGRLTLDGLTPGTPIYMSPEQATGKNIAAPCDVYSLGVIAYEALRGAPPFDGRTLAEVVSMHLASEPPPLAERSVAPPELCALVHRMLDKRPSARPTALDIGREARAIAVELAAYDAYELDESPVVPVTRVVRGRPPLFEMVEPVPSDEVVVVDPEVLEHGATELMPVVRKARWTPELGIASELHTQPLRRPPITPTSTRREVSGEILVSAKHR